MFQGSVNMTCLLGVLMFMSGSFVTCMAQKEKAKAASKAAKRKAGDDEKDKGKQRKKGKGKDKEDEETAEAGEDGKLDRKETSRMITSLKYTADPILNKSGIGLEDAKKAWKSTSIFLTTGKVNFSPSFKKMAKRR